MLGSFLQTMCPFKRRIFGLPVFFFLAYNESTLGFPRIIFSRPNFSTEPLLQVAYAANSPAGGAEFKTSSKILTSMSKNATTVMRNAPIAVCLSFSACYEIPHFRHRYSNSSSAFSKVPRSPHCVPLLFCANSSKVFAIASCRTTRFSEQTASRSNPLGTVCGEKNTGPIFKKRVPALSLISNNFVLQSKLRVLIFIDQHFESRIYDHDLVLIRSFVDLDKGTGHVVYVAKVKLQVECTVYSAQEMRQISTTRRENLPEIPDGFLLGQFGQCVLDLRFRIAIK